MVVILRPGLDVIGAGQLLTLFSSLVWACALLVIKTLSRTDASVTIISYMALLMIPDGAAGRLRLALAGRRRACLAGPDRAARRHRPVRHDRGAPARRHRGGDADRLCKLIWVALLAYLAFGEILDRFTWLGGTLVFASVLYIAYRGRRLAPSPPPRRGPMPSERG